MFVIQAVRTYSTVLRSAAWLIYQFWLLKKSEGNVLLVDIQIFGFFNDRNHDNGERDRWLFSFILLSVVMKDYWIDSHVPNMQYLINSATQCNKSTMMCLPIFQDISSFYPFSHHHNRDNDLFFDSLTTSSAIKDISFFSSSMLFRASSVNQGNLPSSSAFNFINFSLTLIWKSIFSYLSSPKSPLYSNCDMRNSNSICIAIITNALKSETHWPLMHPQQAYRDRLHSLVLEALCRMPCTSPYPYLLQRRRPLRCNSTYHKPEHMESRLITIIQCLKKVHYFWNPVYSDILPELFPMPAFPRLRRWLPNDSQKTASGLCCRSYCSQMPGTN